MSDNTEPDPEGTRLAELLGSALGGPVIDAEATAPDDTGRVLPSSPERPREQSAASWRERAEAAEEKLAAIEAYCRTRPEMAGAGFPQMAGDILAIIGSEEKGDDGYDRDFAGPVL